MTHTLYYSPRCKHCCNIFQTIQAAKLSNVNAVNIDKQLVQGIRSVPTIRSSEGETYVGRTAFEFVDKLKEDNTIQPFECGFGTGLYSSISQDNALCESQQGFTFLTPDGFVTDYRGAGSGGNIDNSSSQNESVSDKTKQQNSELDSLIEQRKLDLPGPLKRT